MNNEIISVEDVIKIKQSDIISTFSDTDKINKLIDLVRSVSFIGEIDLDSKKGRDEITSRAYRVTKMKSGVIKKIITPSIDEHKKIVQAVSVGKRHFEGRMDWMRDEIKKPLKEWDAEQEIIEKERKEKILSKIERITAFGCELEKYGKGHLISMIETVDNIDTSEGYGEFEPGALRAKEVAGEKLLMTLKQLLQKDEAEQQRQELAEQKAELAEQQRKIDEAEKQRKKEQLIKDKLTEFVQIPLNYINSHSTKIQNEIDNFRGYQVKEADFGDRAEEVKDLIVNVVHKLQVMYRQTKQREDLEEQKQRDQEAVIEATLAPKNEPVPHTDGLLDGVINEGVKTQSRDESKDIPALPPSSPDNETVESKPSQEIISITVFSKGEIGAGDARIQFTDMIYKLVKYKKGKDINSVLELLELPENWQN